MRFTIPFTFDADDAKEAMKLQTWLNDVTVKIGGKAGMPHPVTEVMKQTVVYTDGGCKKAQGLGAWAYVIENSGEIVLENYGVEPETTNNRMEMMAVIKALAALAPGTKATVVCDSKYVIEGATKWISGWKKKGWLTFEKQPVKNRDLWEQIDQLGSILALTWEHTSGHIGVPGNERCDMLCNTAMDSYEALHA